MSQSVKPATKPTSNKRDPESDAYLQQVKKARQQFFIAGLNMSWQLAIVVLVPIFGGYKLDEHFNSSPLWTLSGFVLALLLMGLVLRNQLQIASPSIPEKPKTKKGAK